MRDLLKKLFQESYKRSRWMRVLYTLAILVVFVTTYALIIPAITMTRSEQVLDCHYHIHQHDESCYEEGEDGSLRLVCGMADFVLHEHNDSCYDDEGNLVCPLPEIEEHQHDENCWREVRGDLICDLEETEGHVHTEDCYELVRGDLICGLEETEDHVHTDDCYEWDHVLSCDQEEEEPHQHTEDCYEHHLVFVCDEEERILHRHTDDCYDEDGELICGLLQLDKHTHRAGCFTTVEIEEEKTAPAAVPEPLTFSAKTETMQVTVFADAEAFPDGTEMSVADVYEPSVLAAITDAVDGEVVYVHAVDITFCCDGEEVEPAVPIRVTMTLLDPPEEAEQSVLHFDQEGEVSVVEQERSTEPEVVFQSDSFSIYAVVGVKIEQTILASDGNLYRITLVGDPAAGIPDDASLDVTEIPFGSLEFEDLLSEAEAVLGYESGSVSYARFFDISILDGDGVPMQPAEGQTVNVSIQLTDRAEVSEDAQVIHFKDRPEVMDYAANGDTVSFRTDSFSVYGIVDAPEPIPATWNLVTSLEDLANHGSEGLYIKHIDGYYFTGISQKINNNGRTGIIKTSVANSPDDEAALGACKYYFESVGQNQYRVFCFNGDTPRYINQTGNSLSLTTEEEASVFTVSAFPNAANTFRVLGSGGYYWNMRGGADGESFAAWNNATDPNAKIQFEYTTRDDDQYGLDGKSFGIAYQDDAAVAAALMAGSEGLSRQDMVMRPDVLDNEGILLVAEGSDITEWTFHSLEEDRYYITAAVDGQTKYLTIHEGNIALEDAPSSASIITATPGTGANSGKWRFSCGNCSLNLSSGGFDSSTDINNTIWMNLVEKSVLGDDDFQLYSARKVSVSDTVQVPDGAKLIIYTRIWNDTKKRYEFFAIDHDGSLIRCYDAGDMIEWIGSKVNTAVWDFTEYHYSDGTPNYYYEFQNEQYGDYIAPQMTGGQILSDSTLGVNLNGRRNGEDFTTIIAWDDAHYSYVGLKTENGHIVSCPLKDAEDFYFAIVQPVDPTEPLSTVNTINNNEYGITMQMVDFNNPKTGSAGSDRDTQQALYLGGGNSNAAGLLSTDLKEDGYPVTTSATDGQVHSLEGLFQGTAADPLTPVNHLFLESIHNESGYFEYDSTQNFAHLNNDGTFTVYDQLGAIGDYESPTNMHGQFMPYDSLYDADGNPKPYSDKYFNTTNVLAEDLPDTDPRKGEKLINIGNRNKVDYHFGMVMEASFTQTVSGLDAWGHDIIFEFSGDDDFWFYVDGELVLDLGGVHSAMEGSINFRTGQVHSGRKITLRTATGTVDKTDYTLREIFESNYRTRNPEATAAEVAAYLAQYFEEGETVFKDYTNHDMKMFYMERGCGASNLHMRFNLASVKPGTFILSKKLSGTESSSSTLVEFPYQIWYTSKDDPVMHLFGEKSGEREKVLYEGTSTQVRYAASFTPAGGTAAYEHVFFLQPGQSAEVELPDDTLEYWVVECGVNPDIYDEVKANDTALSGAPTTNLVNGTAREDYTTTSATTKDRPRVDYVNHVNEDSIRTLTIAKKLYDKDGTTVLHYPQDPDHPAALEDPTPFSFRLYLGDENADPVSLPGANMFSYHVKGPDGSYCRWDTTSQKFVSIGKSNYAELTDEEKESVTFATSMNGSISKIPTDHTVEVRDLIVSTQFKVEEREAEIPRGYTLRQGDGYQRIDTGHEHNNAAVPISDVIQVDEDPAILVSNQIGWGLTAEKVWTDKDFMQSHDPVYFAIYLKGNLLENTLRQIKSPDTSLYYFFLDLAADSAFSDYVVREVEVTFPGGETPSIDSNGYVLNTGCTVTPVSEGGTLTVGGKPQVGSYQPDYTYTVSYQVGAPTGHNENVRVDKVTNSRPGIAIYKTNLQNDPLSKGVFTLKDAEGHDMGLSTYTSGDDGLITIAYLPAGTYYLTETRSPRGYIGLDAPLKITVDADSHVTLEGPMSILFDSNTADPAMITTIRVKNRSTGFRALKVDLITNIPLAGTHFALYRQVKNIDGDLVKDYLPIPGMEDLVTDASGIIPGITMELGEGTYYLTETSPSAGYAALTGDLCFTIGSDGSVRHEDAYSSIGEAGWLSMAEDNVTHTVSYVYTIPNEHYELPSTGGMGDLAVELPGAVIAVSTALLYRRRKKKHDR